MVKKSDQQSAKKRNVLDDVEELSSCAESDLEEVPPVRGKAPRKKRKEEENDDEPDTAMSDSSEEEESPKTKRTTRRAAAKAGTSPSKPARLTRTGSKRTLEGDAAVDVDMSNSEGEEDDETDEEEEKEEEESIFQRALATLPSHVKDPAVAKKIRQLRLRRSEPMAIFSLIKDELESQGNALNPVAKKLLKMTVRAIKNGPPEKKRDPNQKFKPRGRILDKNLKKKVVMKNLDGGFNLSCRFFLGNNYLIRTGAIEYTSGRKTSTEKEVMRVLSIIRLPLDPTKSKEYRFNIPLRYVSFLRLHPRLSFIFFLLIFESLSRRLRMFAKFWRTLWRTEKNPTSSPSRLWRTTRPAIWNSWTKTGMSTPMITTSEG
jgi:hypothetical protein